MKRLFPRAYFTALFYYQDGKCALCGRLLIGDSEIDHIIPFSKGGQTELENAQLVHKICNRKKSNKYEDNK